MNTNETAMNAQNLPDSIKNAQNLSDSTKKDSLTKSKVTFRFIIAAIIGIILFFVKLPVQGTMILPIDWITGKVSGTLAPFVLPIGLISSVYVAYNLYVTKFWKGRPFEIVLNLMAILAMVLFVCHAIGMMPQFFIDNGVYHNALNTLGKFTISIATIMFFLPPLIAFGLPEAIGVFARPITRPLFKLPGKSAVIIVSAFMGNFTVGHLQTNELYAKGKINHKESAIIATGFCTSSIGLIISVLGAAGQMKRFTLIFFLLLICTLVISCITAHIYPLNKYPTNYYEGVTPSPEEHEKGNMFKQAYEAGIEAAQNTNSITKECIQFGLKSLPVVAKIYVGGIGAMIAFGLINMYTPIFKWIGMIFYPLIKLVGLQDVEIIARSIGINAVDNVTSQLMLVTAPGVALSTVLFGCGFGILTVIFFGPYLASLYSTKIKIKFLDLVLIWFERTCLAILIWGTIVRFLA